MESRRENASQHESACARVAVQFRSLWLRNYVRTKLRTDRVYSVAYDLLGASPEPILDVGCGVGLLGFYLRERACRQPILGLDLDARKIGYGSTIAARGYPGIELRFQNVEAPLPDFCGNVALFDVLHYLRPRAQTALLTRVAERIAPGGLLVIREALRERRVRYWLTCLAEKFAQAISWNIDGALHFPSRAGINAAFEMADFDRESRPLWGASPFNNYLFIFRRNASAVVPAAE
ncbi:MAG TPA: class I SAM-dependent methyltransferase [Chthoniobacterales bacterium]|nr:class I SAM-dependent methyltransferase [Chthoniobacterales bacterium]